jgi:spore coat polysaccharide biosynthesis protein SpsF
MIQISKDETGILIAVRMKSSRLKNKALGMIAGKPVIVHLIERMKQVRQAGKIVLCTSTHPDDRILMDIASQEGIFAFAGSELDVMKRFIDAAQKHHLKKIVRVTGDNPLTDPATIDRLIQEHIQGGYDFSKSEYLPLGVNAEVISLSTLLKAYETAEDTSLTEYMTTYLKRPDIFKVHVLENHEKFLERRAAIRLTVDYEEDLKVMNLIYDALYPTNPNFTIHNVLGFLDEHPDILQINANVTQIPLPKIYFKGEKKGSKKIVLLCEDIDGQARQMIEAIRKTDEYDIVGFVHNRSDIQFSLVDNIPVLGRCMDLDKMTFDAGYFCSAFPDGFMKERLEQILVRKGLKKVDIVIAGVKR